MSALVKAAKFSVELANRKPGVIYTAVRHHWNYEYKPGPVPRNEEERKKAAEKYGIPVAAYEHYPDDGTSNGDYPKIPIISGEAKSDYYPWDNPGLKRNFNEVVSADEMLYNETRYDISYRHRYPMWLQWTTFFGVVGSFFGLWYILEDYKNFRPALPKQMPGKGVVNYGFPESAPKEHH